MRMKRLEGRSHSHRHGFKERFLKQDFTVFSITCIYEGGPLLGGIWDILLTYLVIFEWPFCHVLSLQQQALHKSPSRSSTPKTLGKFVLYDVDLRNGFPLWDFVPQIQQPSLLQYFVASSDTNVSNTVTKTISILIIAN